MFKLLRYFSIVSFVALVFTTAILINLNRHMAINQLTALTGKQNTGLAQSVAENLQPAGAIHAFDAITGDLDQLIASLAISEIDIYDNNGIIIFSSLPGRIGEDHGKQAEFIAANRNARSSSRLNHHKQLLDDAGEPARREVVETYVPIRGADKNVIAVFHLYTDVTAQMVQIEEFQTRLTKVLLLSFILLYGILFLIVRHADQILHRQYQNLLHNEQKIRRTHRQLEQEASQRAQIEQALQQAQETLELSGTALPRKQIA